VAAGTTVDGATPNDWRDEAGRRGGELAPTSLTDGGLPSYLPWDPFDMEPGRDRLSLAVDEAIAATRTATFPALGLDPLAP